MYVYVCMCVYIYIYRIPSNQRTCITISCGHVFRGLPAPARADVNVGACLNLVLLLLCALVLFEPSIIIIIIITRV